MEHWDPNGVQYLETMRDALEEFGLIKFVRRGVIEGWRANLDRYDPDGLFDDPFTLGVTSSRNLINRLAREIPRDAGLRATGVVARPELNSLVLRTPGGVDLRLAKVPHASGRDPDFVSDFDWDETAGRRAAAERNLAAYPCPSPPDVSTIPLFQSPLPRAAELVKQCRDAFLIWGASSDSSLTAGWLGLPTMSASRFIAVVDLWRDASTAATEHDRSTGPAPAVGTTFESGEVPVPVIGIKRTRQPGQS